MRSNLGIVYYSQRIGTWMQTACQTNFFSIYLGTQEGPLDGHRGSNSAGEIQLGQQGRPAPSLPLCGLAQWPADWLVDGLADPRNPIKGWDGFLYPCTP